MLEVEASTEGDDWPDLAWRERAATAVRAALLASQHPHLVEGRLTTEVSVKLSTDAEVRTLNSQYRGKDKPTNVLSFPLVQADLLPAMTNSDDGEVLLGDIILAYETCAREAAEKDVSLEHHAVHLIVHGTLHLIGYDHENEPDALVMERLETDILKKLNIADPYAERPAAPDEAEDQ
ncbi:rRNA maturation RNase YbeY [Pacificimonas sp. ICDLI1SI03]|tara:strand:- start:121864 stop:122397 length:534 start_codon:yes stop_codon:yes gene_type:complete